MPNYYDDIATIYDLTRQYPAELIESAINFILQSPNKHPISVLDLGAGTGLLSIPFSKKVDSLYAVDPSLPMLGVLQAKASKECASNICIVAGAAETIPCEPSTFDIVLTSHVLQLTNKEQALKEIHRVLKPDGYHVECQCLWPEHRVEIEKLWQVARGLEPKPMRSTTSEIRAPEFTKTWVLKETIAERLQAYQSRSHASCWGIDDNEFNEIFARFKELVISRFGGEAKLLVSEAVFEVYVN